LNKLLSFEINSSLKIQENTRHFWLETLYQSLDTSNCGKMLWERKIYIYYLRLFILTLM